VLITFSKRTTSCAKIHKKIGKRGKISFLDQISVKVENQKLVIEMVVEK
jgi:hypothetical protein